MHQIETAIENPDLRLSEWQKSELLEACARSKREMHSDFDAREKSAVDTAVSKAVSKAWSIAVPLIILFTWIASSQSHEKGYCE